MRFTILPLLCAILLATGSTEANSGTMGDKIAIVVNDAAITASDLQARYRMALLSSGLPDEPEVRKRIMPQVAKGLIDEQIQLQEARRQQINVTQADIDQAMKRIAVDNNVPGGDMRVFLNTHGVPATTLEAQARANIAWMKLVQRQLRPHVEIGDDEVDEALDRLRANAGKQEYFINEISLPVDDPDQEVTIRQFADKLLHQIRETGAFGAIARQFSQGIGAQNGGEIGWVQEGTLAPEIDRALAASNKGELLGPIKTSTGFHIIAIRDVRRVQGGGGESIVKIMQMTLGFDPQRDKKITLETAENVRGTINGCGTLMQKYDAKSGWKLQEMAPTPIAKLPEWLAEPAKNLKVGMASRVFSTGNAAAIFVLCERTEKSDATDREAIINKIGSERLENLARGMLRDLKRNAHIDVRS
ncbi:MAG: peptidylprolyl isomerase [Alphaproteobacteria bacterium]